MTGAAWAFMLVSWTVILGSAAISLNKIINQK